MTEGTARPGFSAGELDRWLASVADALDLDLAVLSEVSAPVLDMVRVVAHGVSRPAAPLTAFVLGLATGAGGHPTPDGIRAGVLLVEQLVREWVPEQ
jgi:hypothetical protein